jgi:hypothetical protein
VHLLMIAVLYSHFPVNLMMPVKMVCDMIFQWING